MMPVTMAEEIQARAWEPVKTVLRAVEEMATIFVD